MAHGGVENKGDLAVEHTVLPDLGFPRVTTVLAQRRSTKTHLERVAMVTVVLTFACSR